MADVTQASKEIGKKYHEKMIENIVKFVKWLKEMDVWGLDGEGKYETGNAYRRDYFQSA